MGWREDIVQALTNLGGEANLSDIYEEIRNVRGNNLNATFDATIRGTIEANSSDSRVWRTGNPDLFQKISSGRWALRTQAIPPRVSQVIDGISRDDILAAFVELDNGAANDFGDSTRYDVLFQNRRYPPKAAVGLAARRQLGRPLSPDEFSGGLNSACFRVLEKNGFEIVEKQTIDVSGGVGGVNTSDARYWAIAPGEGGRLWNEWQEKGLVAIGWDYLGNLEEYPDQGAISAAIIDHDGPETQPINSSLACWQFLRVMKRGDIVIAKQGRRRLLGAGIVESNYIYDSTRAAYQQVRKVKWSVSKTVDLPDNLLLPTKALTDVTEYSDFVDFVGEAYFAQEPPVTHAEEPFDIDDAMLGLFMPRTQFEELLEALRFRKNLIIQGPPGVGKSYVAKRLAYALVGHKDASCVQMVQFHQSYAYEDFIQGWRPNGAGGFALKNGVFYNFANTARMNLERPHVFIIDEVSRGNLSKIFGELMMLIEADKRGADHAIPLTYSESGERFSVPENLYILGLMNTADRSLAMVDYALRRRFRFAELVPAFAGDTFAEHLREHHASTDLVNRIVGRLSKLNRKIEADHKNLGRGYVIGHSFFCIADPSVIADDAWYRTVVRTEVAPLLEEYWFDRRETAEQWIDELLAP